MGIRYDTVQYCSGNSLVEIRQKCRVQPHSSCIIQCLEAQLSNRGQIEVIGGLVGEGARDVAHPPTIHKPDCPIDIRPRSAREEEDGPRHVLAK